MAVAPGATRREPGSGSQPRPPAWPAAGRGCDPDEEAVDLAEVGRAELQCHEDALGSHTTDPPTLRITKRLPGTVLQIAVHPLVGAAQGGIRGLPLVAAVEEGLGELGPGLRWHGDALLGADRWRVVGHRGDNRDPQPALGARADRGGLQVTAGLWVPKMSSGQPE